MPFNLTDILPDLDRYITVPNATATTGYAVPAGYTTTTATIDASAIRTGNQYFVSTPYVTGTTTATGTAWQNYATTNPHYIAHYDYVPVSHITYSRDYVDDLEEKDIGVENMEMDDDTSEIDNFLAEFTIREED